MPRNTSVSFLRGTRGGFVAAAVPSPGKKLTPPDHLHAEGAFGPAFGRSILEWFPWGGVAADQTGFQLCPRRAAELQLALQPLNAVGCTRPLHPEHRSSASLLDW